MSPLHNSTTTPAKSAHYANALTAALLAGEWGDKSAVKAVNGSLLGWQEGVRKWGKHTAGDTEYIHLLRTVSLAYLPLGATSPADRASIPQLRSQPLHVSLTGRTTHPEPSSNPDHVPVVLAPIAPVEGYALPDPTTTTTTTSNASSSVSSSHPSRGVHSIDTHSASSTDRTESSSSFIHVSHHPEDEERGPGDRRAEEKEPVAEGMAEGVAEKPVEDSGSGVTVTQSRPTAHARHPTPAPTTNPAAAAAAAGATFLSPAYLDGDDAETGIPSLAPDHWWIGRHGLQGESRVDVEDGLKRISALRRGGSIAQTRAVDLLSAFYHHALGNHARAYEVLQTVDWTSAMDPGWALGLAYQQLDLIRGKVLLGLTIELLGRDETLAMGAYAQAVRLYADLPGLVIPLTTSFLVRDTPPAPAPAPGPTPPTFTLLRDAHRWIARALCRGSVLAARAPDVGATLKWTRTYHAIAHLWPARFRPSQRCWMLKLYLSALHNTYIPHPASPAADAATVVGEFFIFPKPSTVIPRGTTAQLWARETLAAVEQGRALLADVTDFPRAGSVNWRVAEFMGACVRLWERSGYASVLAAETIKVLWWGMSFTFQSQALLRSLTRLLYATGAHDDARKTFELYVKVVLKARETAQPDRALEIKPRSFVDDVPPLGDVPAARADRGVETLEEANEDSDREFVGALVLGARLLALEHADPREAWRYLVLAGEVVESGGGASGAVMAQVEEAKGITRMALAAQGVDPLVRPTYQAQGIDHLLAAVKLNPCPSTYYHLAYANAEARRIDDAVDAIRTSIELEPASVPAWHLLALLLSARKDWSGALRATQVGVQTWEIREEQLQRLRPPPASSMVEPPPTETAPLDSTVSHLDFAIQREQTTDEPLREQVLLVGEQLVPLAMPSDASTLGPLRTADRLTEIIQLRITQAVIIEKAEGTNDALAKQHETFIYLSNKSHDIREEAAALHESVASVGSTRGPDVGESFIAVDSGTHLSLKHTLTRTATRESHKSTASHAADPEKHSTRKHRFIGKHLHVPSSRKDGDPSIPAKEPQDRRLISSGSSIYSRHTTPAHSHYQGSRTTPPPPPSTQNSLASWRSKVECKLLAELWLQIAATFRRSGQLDQAFAAVQEAEVADAENAEVWVQLGLYHHTMGDEPLALETLSKALVLDPDSAQAVVRLAESFIGSKQYDMAHGLLNSYTQGKGWDVPEAWYFLAKACEGQGGRHARVRECLLYALQLEKGRTCRPLAGAICLWIQ